MSNLQNKLFVWFVRFYRFESERYLVKSNKLKY